MQHIDVNNSCIPLVTQTSMAQHNHNRRHSVWIRPRLTVDDVVCLASVHHCSVWCARRLRRRVALVKRERDEKKGDDIGQTMLTRILDGITIMLYWKAQSAYCFPVSGRDVLIDNDAQIVREVCFISNKTRKNKTLTRQSCGEVSKITIFGKTKI